MFEIKYSEYIQNVHKEISVPLCQLWFPDSVCSSTL